MRIEAKTNHKAQEARDELEKLAAQKTSICYQCGKCFAGCPMAFAMNIPPSQIMRLVQMGDVDEALKSNTIWICSACETCTTRCPQEVDIARVMDSLRNLAYSKGLKAKDKKVKLAHQVFLDNLQRFGRIFEPWLIFIYNLRSGQFFKDTEKGPAMMLKGKLPFFPKTIKGVKNVRKIFANVKNLRDTQAAEVKDANRSHIEKKEEGCKCQ